MRRYFQSEVEHLRQPWKAMSLNLAGIRCAFRSNSVCPYLSVDGAVLYGILEEFLGEWSLLGR